MAPRLFSIASVIFLLAMPAPARLCRAEASPDDLTYVSESHGFTIKRPDASWTFQESLNPADGMLTLVIQPESAAGLAQVTIRAKLLVAPTDARSVRDKLLKDIRTKPEYLEMRKGSFKVRGKSAPGMILEMKASNQVFRVHLCYVIENEMVYHLQSHAPIGKFDSYAPTFRGVWNSFKVSAISPELKEERRLLTLAAKCGTEIDWSSHWEDASRRARKEKKLVLVYARLMRGFSISDEVSSGAFMDPYIVDLVRERYVALRFEQGMEAPFTSQDSYGMGPFTLGTSLLLVTPKGNVVGDTFGMETTALHIFLVETLAKFPKFTGKSVPRRLKGADLAEWHLRRGEYDEAGKILESPLTAREHRLRASLMRRLRMGVEALAALEECRKAEEGEARADLSVEESVVLLRMGRFSDAQDKLTRFTDDYPDSAKAPEALYWLGACRLRRSGTEEAESVWRNLIELHEESPWAWRAAAALKSTRFSIGEGQRLDWPPEEILAVCRTAEPEKLKRSKAQEAERDALQYILSRQRSNGSWISPAEVGRFSAKEPHAFTTAITAICGQALLQYRHVPGAKEAVKRAVDFVLDACQKEKSAEKKAHFMDYSIYSNAYALWFFADCIREGLIEREKLRPVMEWHISELQVKQNEGGGWSYYLTTDLDNADNPANQSISFVTALELIALLETRDAGIPVPEEMIERARKCLERMYNSNGTFEYMLFFGQEDRPRGTARPGAAGRGPLCSLALFRAGGGDLNLIRKTLNIFLDHRKSYAALHRKTLMHTGPDGQGSHYLMLDYAYAAAASKVLPKGERGRFKRALLEQILGARSDDGSYIDNPINGPHYGTAMALIAFRHLGPL
ncbi:MAG: hypothetical protein O7H41_01655 [Planctomycetota bacterium]|nr:hypothetical protein [Planctomycetota bacterium]